MVFTQVHFCLRWVTKQDSDMVGERRKEAIFHTVTGCCDFKVSLTVLPYPQDSATTPARTLNKATFLSSFWAVLAFLFMIQIYCLLLVYWSKGTCMFKRRESNEVKGCTLAVSGCTCVQQSMQCKMHEPVMLLSTVWPCREGGGSTGVRTPALFP